jgi:integrase
MSITRAAVKAAQPAAEKYFIWDDRTPGLGLRVMPSGVVSWIYKYRTQSGVQRTQTLGRADIIHPDEARALAAKLYLQVRDGDDPMAALAAKRATPTVAKACEEFVEVHFPLVRPSTRKSYGGLIKNHIVPRFGNRRIDSIDMAEIRKWKADYVETPQKFNHSRDLLAMVVDYAIERKWAEHNPIRIRRLKNYPDHARKRYLTIDEAPRLGAALRDYGQQSDMRWRFAAFITLLLVTGCRASEICKARWEWIEWDEKRINWPRTKTGPDEHVLPDSAIELLKELHRRIPGNPWVIAGAKLGQPLAAYGKMWREVCKMAQIENLRVHDLRKSFASIALAQGFGLDMIAMMLRHANPTITAERYAFLMSDVRKQAVNQTADAVFDRLRPIP